MSESWNGGTRYEAPSITFYGDITSLTQSVLSEPSTDAPCTGHGVPTAGVPSGIVCKSIP